MNLLKRSFSAFLCILIVLPCVVFSPVRLEASSLSTVAAIARLKKQFPAGKYWNHVGSDKNNPDGYTSTPCTHHGRNGSGCKIKEGGCECNFFNNSIQCAGYAYRTAYALTGSKAGEGNGWTKLSSLNVSQLCVGDVIRYLNNGHSITVLGCSGTTIAYTGANWGGNCLIKWGTMDKSEITGFSYVYHKNDNKTKNSDFSFLDGSGNEIWKAKDTNNASLNIRSSASTNASVIGSIPPGKKFEVISKSYSTTTKYLWAKVRYENITGYAVLNYTTYVSGSIETLELVNLSDIYSGVSCQLNWNSIDGADTYKIYIYDSNGILLKTYTSDSTSRYITLSNPSEYFIRITATNSQVTSWKVSSDKIAVSVFSSKLMKITEIDIPDSMVITAGKSEFCDYQIFPIGATSDMTWSTADKSIATVSSSGVITGKAPGQTVVTCKSKSSSVSAKCKVTVNPKKVTGLVQTASGTNASQLKITWKAVSGATGYRLYLVRSGGGYKKVADVKTNSYTYKKLSAGAKLRFVVRAFQKVEGKAYFGPYSAKAYAFTKPPKVTGLKCTSQTVDGYTLKWSKAKNATEYRVSQYNESKKSWKIIATVKKNSYTLKGSAKGAAAIYAVSAVIVNKKVSLVGARSASVYGFRAPTAPVLKKSAVEKKSVTLKWSKSTGATSYEIYQKIDGKYALIKTVKNTVLTYTVSKLTTKTDYRFAVKAVSAHGSQIKRTTSNILGVKTS